MPSRPNGLFAPRDWDALRRAYEAHEGNLADLAADSGLMVTTLQRYARERHWRRPVTVTSESQPPPPPTSQRRPSQSRAANPANVIGERRGVIVERLLDVVMRKLEQLEQDMTTAETSADHERHARAIGVLASTVEKVDDLSRGNIPTGKRGTDKSDNDKPANDANELRRELAARIQRLGQRLGRGT